MLSCGQHFLTLLNCGISKCHDTIVKDFAQSMSSILQKTKKYL